MKPSAQLRILTLGLSCGCLLSATAVHADERIDFFERKIRPVLVEHCYSCHSAGADAVKGGLRVDTKSAIQQGGESGAAVVAGDTDAGLLLSALRYESFEMPPDGPLDDRVIADFESWIKNGAADPRESEEAGTDEPTIDWQSVRQFWAFQPPTRHTQPEVSRPDWVQKPIDAFILARLDAGEIAPNPVADRYTLIRRVTFDLTGLPPEPSDVDTFVAADSPSAYRELVERLLASPHFGERWARMWMDVARYAEDQAHIVGNNTSLCYPNAHLYRDWLIHAFNEDLPYDRFIELQLAADLLEPERDENLAALGFLGLGPKYYRRNAREVMADEWEDRVDTVARGLLGLTVACARCHDHKFDPIPTEDYYALAGIFASTEMYNRPLNEDCERNGDGQAKKAEDALHILRDGKPEDLHVAIRGDVSSPGPLVPRRFLQVLSRDTAATFRQGSGRGELAAAITDRNNPLTARVFVNRVWKLIFGQPLVATTSNFGALGQQPTHPQLLDDLAVRWMENDWSIKWLLRELVLSSTYRQSSELRAAGLSADPANRLLWRMNRRRLDVEAWRDAILHAVGRLERSAGGRSIEPDDPQQRRRTVYARISRLEMNKMLATFDLPDPNAHSGGRVQTTTPLQKLFVMNSPFMTAQADAFVRRLEDEAGSDDAARIELAYRLLYSRDVDEEERRLAEEYLQVKPDQRSARWSQYAQALLAANEASIID